MSLPKLPTMVVVLLLANLLIVAVSGVDPHSEPADSDDGSARRATSTIYDAISDAQRSTKIGDGVGAAWESGGGTFLTARHVALIENYETMCCAVLIARQNGGAWRSKEAVKLRSIALFSEEDVLNELGIIAWPNHCSEPITLDRDSL